MLKELTLHGVKQLKYSKEEQVYKVQRATTGEVDIDGFVDEVIVSNGHASVVFSVEED